MAEKLDDLTLEQLNWELAIASLNDTIDYIHEVLHHLSRVQENLNLLREGLKWN